MTKKKIINVNHLYLQQTSVINEGMQLEVLAANERGEEIDIGRYPLFSFISLHKDSILMEIYDKDNVIRIPIEKLESAIEASKRLVKDENSFDV